MTSVHAREERLPMIIGAAIFLSCYLTFRPIADVMFTASDVLFILSLVLVSRRPITLTPFGAWSLPWLLALGLVLTGLLIGSIGSADPTRWVIVALQYVFAWLVLPAILVGHGERRTIAMIKALILGVAVMEAVGILVYIGYRGSFEGARATFGLDFLTGARRLGAFTADANWNGAVVGMTLPFVGYLAMKREISLPFAGVLAAVLSAGLLLSASFTAFASAAVALAVFVLTGAVRLSIRAWAGLGVAGMLLWQFRSWLPPTFQVRVGRALVNGDIEEAGTFRGRVMLIEDAWDMVDRHSLVGVGADQFRVVSALHAPVHNTYLLLWAEGGLLSLIGWLGMMAILVGTAVAGFRRNRLAAATALSVLATFFIFSTASPHMYARLWPVPVMLAVALARAGAGRLAPAVRPLPAAPSARRAGRALRAG